MEVDINIEDLKVGDIAAIKFGLSVPCDGLLVPQCTGVSTDEAAMTGESDERFKEVHEICLEKRAEVLEDEKEMKMTESERAHAVPSPVFMSGT